MTKVSQKGVPWRTVHYGCHVLSVDELPHGDGANYEAGYGKRVALTLQIQACTCQVTPNPLSDWIITSTSGRRGKKISKQPKRKDGASFRTAGGSTTSNRPYYCLSHDSKPAMGKRSQKFSSGELIHREQIQMGISVYSNFHSQCPMEVVNTCHLYLLLLVLLHRSLIRADTALPGLPQ